MVPSSPERTSPRNGKRHYGWQLVRLVAIVGGAAMMAVTYTTDPKVASFESVMLRRQAMDAIGSQSLSSFPNNKDTTATTSIPISSTNTSSQDTTSIPTSGIPSSVFVTNERRAEQQQQEEQDETVQVQVVSTHTPVEWQQAKTVAAVADFPQEQEAVVEVDMAIGDKISVLSGPFKDFDGEVIEVSPERSKLKALLSIFGRDTPVELEFNQVEKQN